MIRESEPHIEYDLDGADGVRIWSINADTDELIEHDFPCSHIIADDWTISPRFVAMLSRAVTSTPASHTLTKAFRGFGGGEMKVLVNANLFGEGFDVPADEFQTALRLKEALELTVASASKSLKDFPKGSNGLTPDDVKASEKYREAAEVFRDANLKLKDFNMFFMKNYKAEYKAHRNQRLGSL